MAHAKITLDVAAFLDSAEAAPLEPGREDVRKIVGRFLSVCYDELGKAPKYLDGHDVHDALGHRMPEKFARKDPLAPHVPAVLSAFFEHLEATQVVTQSFEIKNALAGTAGEFLETVRTGHNAHAGHAHQAQDPFVHGAPKLGRNDPCSCGSGKKYKKCHGKNA